MAVPEPRTLSSNDLATLSGASGERIWQGDIKGQAFWTISAAAKEMGYQASVRGATLTYSSHNKTNGDRFNRHDDGATASSRIGGYTFRNG